MRFLLSPSTLVDILLAAAALLLEYLFATYQLLYLVYYVLHMAACGYTGEYRRGLGQRRMVDMCSDSGRELRSQCYDLALADVEEFFAQPSNHSGVAILDSICPTHEYRWAKHVCRRDVLACIMLVVL